MLNSWTFKMLMWYISHHFYIYVLTEGTFFQVAVGWNLPYPNLINFVFFFLHIIYHCSFTTWVCSFFNLLTNVNSWKPMLMAQQTCHFVVGGRRSMNSAGYGNARPRPNLSGKKFFFYSNSLLHHMGYIQDWSCIMWNPRNKNTLFQHFLRMF